MMYVSVAQILRIHFVMGICFGVGAAAYARYQGRPRRWLAFGGEAFSLGEGARWLRWYVIAFGFEVVTSLAPGHMLYVELSLSFIEAAAIVVGAFLVDRLLLLFEFGTPEIPKGRPRQSLREKLRAARARREGDQRATRQAFDDLTRRH